MGVLALRDISWYTMPQRTKRKQGKCAVQVLLDNMGYAKDVRQRPSALLLLVSDASATGSETVYFRRSSTISILFFSSKRLRKL